MMTLHCDRRSDLFLYEAGETLQSDLDKFTNDIQQTADSDDHLAHVIYLPIINKLNNINSKHQLISLIKYSTAL